MLKYVVVGLVGIAFLNRYMEFTEFGKVFVKVAKTVLVLAVIVIPTQFSIITSKTLINVNTIMYSVEKWENIEKVSTRKYAKTMRNSGGISDTKQIKEYRVTFKGGNEYEIWRNINNIYKVHTILKDKNKEISF